MAKLSKKGDEICKKINLKSRKESEEKRENHRRKRGGNNQRKRARKFLENMVRNLCLFGTARVSSCRHFQKFKETEKKKVLKTGDKICKEINLK